MISIIVPFLRSTYNYDRNEASDDSSLMCLDASLTQQSFKEECDINTIVERFGVGYSMPEGVVAPTYQDFEGVYDFRTAATALAAARESFDSLPANVRARFQNDPAAFVDFCEKEENRAEAEKLGLVVPRPLAELGARATAHPGEAAPTPPGGAIIGVAPAGGAT